MQGSVSGATSTSSSLTLAAESETSGIFFFLVLRRTGTLDAETADEHDSTSETSSSWFAILLASLLVLLRVTGMLMSDTAEQHESTSDASPSCTEPTGVLGLSGLWSLEALLHLFLAEAGSGLPPATFSSWLLASTTV